MGCVKLSSHLSRQVHNAKGFLRTGPGLHDSRLSSMTSALRRAAAAVIDHRNVVREGLVRLSNYGNRVEHVKTCHPARIES